MFVFKEKIPSELIEKIWGCSESSSNPSDIFQMLIENGFIEMHEVRKADDKIVIYFHENSAMHFGKIEQDKVVSKWGIGLVWEHPVFEVPFSYGNEVKYSNGKIDFKILKKVINDL